MMKKILLVIFMFACWNVGAQVSYFNDERIEQLKNVSQKDLKDSVAIIINELDKYENNYRYHKLNKILEILPENAVDARLLAMHFLAEFAPNKTELIEKAFKYAQQNKCDYYYFDYYLIKTHWFTGVQQYDSALAYVLKAQNYISVDNNPNRNIELLHQLGDLYYGVELFNQAEYYYLKVKEHNNEKLPDFSWRKQVIDNNLALIAIEQGRYRIAYETFSEALLSVPFPQTCYADSLTRCYYNRKIANCMYNLNENCDSALDLLQFSYDFSKKHNLHRQWGEVYYLLVKFYMRKNLVDSVLKYNNEFKLYFNENYDDIVVKRQAQFLSLQAEVNEYLGNNDSALFYYKMYKDFNDSVSAHIKAASVVKMLTEQEYEKLENDYAHVQGQLFFLLGFVVIFLFFVTYLYVYSQKTKRLNQELEEINRTKDKLFSIISHDLRSPFNVIYGFSEMIQDAIDVKDTARIKEYGEIIHNHSADLVHLVDNLLYWSRSQQNGVCVYPEQIRVDEVVKRSLNVVSMQARNKGIELEVKSVESLSCYADDSILVMILNNLISNAIKFSKSGDTITIKENKNETQCLISVIDNGVGMDEEQLSQLFVLKGKQSQLGTADEKGMGLGLIVCKEFIERSNGTISVESEIGKGSTFTILLPLG